MKKFITAAIFLILALQGYAQQDPQYSMFMFNKQVLNPGYVGANGLMEFTLLGRSQWVGITGHPNTATISFNTPVPILFGGLGIHLVQDQIGPFTTTTLAGTYAFKLPIGSKGMALHIGVTPAFNFKSLDGTDFRAREAVDRDPKLRDIAGRVTSVSNFDLGAGLYFYKAPQSPAENGEKFYFGFSMGHLLEPKLGDFGTNFTLARTFNVMGGYRFDLGTTNMSIVPSVMFKMAGNQYQMEFNANFHVRPMVFGLSYRGLSNIDCLNGIVGFNATQRLFIAYSYDYTLSSLGQATSGSHELIISYLIPRVTKIKPPDYDVKDKPEIR